MNDILPLDSFFLKDSQARELNRMVHELNKKRIWIQGLSGSRDAFLAMGCLAQLPQKILIIANDKLRNEKIIFR